MKIILDTSKSTECESVITEVNCPSGKGDTTVPCTSIRIPNMYMKFAPKAVDVMKTLANKKRFFYSYQIATFDSTAPTIYYHIIKSMSHVSTLFEPLKRLGMSLTELKIGTTEDGNCLYLTNKVIRDLSKFNDDMRQELCMYLSSIAYLFTGIVKEVPRLEAVYGNHLDAFITDWTKYIRSFNTSETIEIAEIPTNDLKAVRYFNNLYSTPATLVNAPSENAFSISETEGKRKLILNRTSDKDVFWVYSPDKSHVVYTNGTLCYMDLDYDMFASNFAIALGTTVDVVYVKDLNKKYADDTTHIVTAELDADVYDTDKYFEKIISKYESNPGIAKTKLSYLIKNMKVSSGLVDKDSVVEQYKDDAYAQQLYTQVHEYYDTFDLKTLNNSVRGFANGDIYAMMFIGEAGTGKSTAARVIPYKCGFPYLSVNFCVNIEESDLFGTMIPNPEKNGADDPEFIWQDGIVTKAVRKGYTVVLEEINFARPGVLGKLNSLLDENRQIDLPNGEILKAHPNFRMIATCNIAYEGTNRFNKALINRFEVVHEFKDLDKLEAFKAIKSRIKGVDDTKLGKVYAVYEMLKKYASEQGIDIVVSIRQLFNMFRQGKYYATAYDAIVDCIINGAFVELPEYKEKFVDSVLNNMAKELKFRI